MDASLVYAVFIIFGSLSLIFAEDIRHRGFVTSLPGAKGVCEDHNETLVSAENDEKRKRIIKVLAEHELDAAWLFTNFTTLRNWTFTDRNQTILNDSKIDVAQGGLCGALSSKQGSLLFKSLPCNTELAAVKNDKGCNPSCHLFYNKTNKYRWHSLNKGILATPYENNITSLVAFLLPLRARRFDDFFWISLRKFQFTWPDRTEIPLQQWEDRSKNKGECLILRQNGKMVVVDCETKSSNHSVLCFDKGSEESSSQAFGLKVTISVLGVVCGLLLVAALFIAYSWFQPKCPAGRKQEDNQDNQESRQEENQDNQDDNQDNQAELRPTYEEITDVRLGLKAA